MVMTPVRGSTSPRDMLRIILIGIAVIGALAVVLAVIRYVEATGNRSAAQATIERTRQVLNTTGEGIEPLGALVPLMKQQRDAERQQTQSLFLGGAGLVAVGVGWLGADLARRRKPPSGPE